MIGLLDKRPHHDRMVEAEAYQGFTLPIHPHHSHIVELLCLGGIYVYHISAGIDNKDEPIRSLSFSLPENEQDFHPHGISLYDDRSNGGSLLLFAGNLHLT
jgi:hypothetical protein